jgi:hypothetical protein
VTIGGVMDIKGLVGKMKKYASRYEPIEKIEGPYITRGTSDERYPTEWMELGMAPSDSPIILGSGDDYRAIVKIMGIGGNPEFDNSPGSYNTREGVMGEIHPITESEFSDIFRATI